MTVVWAECVPVRRAGPSLTRARATKNWLPPSRGQDKGSAFREDILPSPVFSLLSKIRKFEVEIGPVLRGWGLTLVYEDRWGGQQWCRDGLWKAEKVGSLPERPKGLVLEGEIGALHITHTHAHTQTCLTEICHFQKQGLCFLAYITIHTNPEREIRAPVLSFKLREGECLRRRHWMRSNSWIQTPIFCFQG